MKVSAIRIVSLTALLAILFLPAKALAALSQGITVVPSATEVTLLEGKDGTVEVFYKNNSEATLGLHLSTIDFGSLNETGGIAFLGANGSSYEQKYGLSHWLQLEKDYLVLPPHTERSIHVTIANEESLSPGGHYGAVLARVDVPLDSGRREITLQSTLSSLLFVNKVGGDVTQVDLRDAIPTRTWYGDITGAKVRFQNSGNTHAVPHGTISLLDPSGMVIKHAVMNDGSGIMLPESFRVFPVSLTPVSIPYRLGTYRLVIQYHVDGHPGYSSKSIPLLYVPPIYLAALTGLFICLAGGIIWMLRRRKKIPKTV